MANQLIIKGPMKVANEILSSNIQNSTYTLPTDLGTEGQVLKVVGGTLAWSSTGTDNDGIIGPLVYNFNSTSPSTFYTAPAGVLIADISVEIVTPFDDPSATLIVGDSVNSSRLLVDDQTDLAASAGQVFSIQPSYVYETEMAVVLNINPASSTQGSFKITLTYIQ